ncbi:MAG: DUF3343 domain-containing protein [Oscillospiraceae bacterium]
MNKSLIALTSITYAMKAKSLINGKGYYCEVVRTPRNLGSGCGYSIQVREKVDVILPILDAAGIRYKDYTTLKN